MNRSLTLITLMPCTQDKTALEKIEDDAKKIANIIKEISKNKKFMILSSTECNALVTSRVIGKVLNTGVYCHNTLITDEKNPRDFKVALELFHKIQDEQKIDVLIIIAGYEYAANYNNRVAESIHLSIRWHHVLHYNPKCPCWGRIVHFPKNNPQTIVESAIITTEGIIVGNDTNIINVLKG